MRAIVLEYHDVVHGDFSGSGFPGVAADSYKLAAADFEAHLAALVGVPATVGGDVRALGDGHTSPPVVLTFDDGGVGACGAADLLERRGWLGHFFVTTERIGTPGFLTTAQLRDLEGRGHVIGSHSHSHPPRMARLTPDEARGEWIRSRAILSDVLGHAVDVASVPGGFYGRFVAVAAAAAGIRWLFTSEPVTAVALVDGCHVLGRYTLRRTSSPASVRALAGRPPTARARQWAVWNAKKVVKAVTGDAYLHLRASLFGEPGARNSSTR